MGATTFTLSCTGEGGNIMRMVSVGAVSALTVNWMAPTENVDGSTLTDLEQYRIYYGQESRTYSNSVDVMSSAATSHTFNALSGDHFITMTALDEEGNESAYSNEILRSVP